MRLEISQVGFPLACHTQYTNGANRGWYFILTYRYERHSAKQSIYRHDSKGHTETRRPVDVRRSTRHQSVSYNKA